MKKDRNPLRHRRNIPFYHDKTEEEIKADPYERYHDMVIRQLVLHAQEQPWMQAADGGLYRFITDHASIIPGASIVELGCGVGRLISDLSHDRPDSQCFGFDYSYQMLSHAHKLWVKGEQLVIDASRFGLGPELKINGRVTNNLQFGLGKAENLRFADQSVDLIYSCFLLDRLSDPREGLQEMIRVAKPNGKILIVTPFNFQKQKDWDLLYPAQKLIDYMSSQGLSLIKSIDPLMIQEQVDIAGNVIQWRCAALAFCKE